jgi:hypothetical protein
MKPSVGHGAFLRLRRLSLTWEINATFENHVPAVQTHPTHTKGTERLPNPLTEKQARPKATLPETEPSVRHYRLQCDAPHIHRRLVPSARKPGRYIPVLQSCDTVCLDPGHNSRKNGPSRLPRSARHATPVRHSESQSHGTGALAAPSTRRKPLRCSACARPLAANPRRGHMTKRLDTTEAKS